MPNNFNNYYNSTNPYFGNPGGNYMTNNTGYQQQTPGYSGFNNFQCSFVPQTLSMIPGRMVANADEITPQEVPMDGSISLFPQNDYSCIYAKTWTKEGTIATMKFIPEQPVAAEPQKSPIEERFDKIDQRFDKLEKMLSNRNKPRKSYDKSVQAKEEQADA